MVSVEDVLEIVTPHADVIGEENMAALKLAIMEKDVAMDTAEIDNLKAELEAERTGRAEDKTAYDAKIKDFNDRFDRFVHGKAPEDVVEEIVEDTVDEVAVDEDDLYEELYGGKE